MKPEILKETSDFIIVHKPAGWLTIPGRAPLSNIPILSHWLGKELNQKIYVVHRLDQGTSGIVLFALTAEAHRFLSMSFEHSEVKKTYLAVVTSPGGKQIENQIIDAPLFKLPGKKNKSVVNKEKGKPSQTIIKKISEKSGLSLVEATPLTGRTHQIRVHLSHIGHPILGDSVYGGITHYADVTIPHPLLHAFKLEFFYPENQKHQIECKPTGLFQDFLFKHFN